MVVGASAGGYAAILFGQLLNADQVLSFGPQTYISDDLRAPLNEKRWGAEISRIPNIHYPDLSKLKIDSSVKSSNVHIFFGGDDFFDFLHAAWLLVIDGVTVSKIPNGDHCVSGTMKRDGLLQPSLENAILGLSEPYPGDYLKKSLEGSSFIRGVIKGDEELNVASICKLVDLFGSTTCLDFALGKEYIRQHEYAKAADIFKVIAARQEFSNFVFMSQVELANCYTKTCNYEQADKWYEKALSRKPYSQGVLLSYAKSLLAQNKSVKAESMLLRCIIHNGNCIGAYYEYAQILLAKQDRPLAIDCLIKARMLRRGLFHVDNLLMVAYQLENNRLEMMRLFRELKLDGYNDIQLTRLESYFNFVK